MNALDEHSQLGETRRGGTAPPQGGTAPPQGGTASPQGGTASPQGGTASRRGRERGCAGGTGRGGTGRGGTGRDGVGEEAFEGTHPLQREQQRRGGDPAGEGVHDGQEGAPELKQHGRLGPEGDLAQRA